MKRQIIRVKYGSPCPYCGCTGRTKYTNVRRVRVGHGRGMKCRFYVTRRTSCRRCKRKRVEFRTEVPK